MDNKKIEILQTLLQDMNKKNFDFEAWRIKTSLLLKRIFGNDDEKVELINNLHYDHSSWSLRDGFGGKQHDPVKEQAREILEAAKLELQLGDTKPDNSDSVIKGNLSNENYQRLASLLENNSTEQELTEYFSNIAPAIKNAILAKIILNK
ncbi:MAG: hypothetical protein PF486_15165 [Prolixibacteraceae bacterium]|jgi:hypothetical protein|nr:hypothetical protein [Prolixibacteraceae bacterium]